MKLSDLFGVRPAARRPDLPPLVDRLAKHLEASREEVIFGILSGLRAEGANVQHIPRLLEPGTELDSALRAFQLTVVVGFAWKKYMDSSLHATFDELLTQRLDNGCPQAISVYREQYLDCEGHVETLTRRAGTDIHRLWDSPEPRHKFVNALTNAARVFAIVSQAQTAAAFGDLKTERTLLSVARG